MEGVGDGFAGGEGWEGELDSHCVGRSGLKGSRLEYSCCGLNYDYLLDARLFIYIEYYLECWYDMQERRATGGYRN